jgi:hypothetical protein
MQIQLTDPRTARWELDHPEYRVYFWRAGRIAPDRTEERAGYQATEYELSDARDVHEVLAWAAENAAADQSYTIYVAIKRTEGLGLARIFGVDPTRGTASQLS